MKYGLVLFILIMSFNGWTSTIAVEDQLKSMAQQGIITEENAKGQSIEMKILKKEQEVFKKQVRDVASTIKKNKDYYFNNQEIEVDASE